MVEVVDKSTNEFGVKGVVEASYGAGGSPGATDAILVVEDPDVVGEYAHDGSRNGRNTGLKKVKASGRFGSVDLLHEMAGGGAAYSASVKPSMHLFLLMAGYAAALDSTLGAEKYTYTPVRRGFSSGALEVFSKGEKHALSGAYCNLSCEADGPVVPLWTAAVQGLLADPADALVPTLTYPSVLPSKAETITLSVGSFLTAVARRFSFNLNREMSGRNDQNSGGHAGFHLGDLNPQLEVFVEKTARVASPYHTVAGLDPEKLFGAGSAIALSLQVGGTKYERWKITSAAAQLAESPDEDSDGSVAMWRLVFDLKPSAPHLADGHSIVAD